jgi:hypothetical protein
MTLTRADVERALVDQIRPAARLAAAELLVSISKNAEHIARQTPIVHTDEQAWQELWVPAVMKELFEALAVELMTAAEGWSELFVRNLPKEEDGRFS